jgi:hypothetical protein
LAARHITRNASTGRNGVAATAATHGLLGDQAPRQICRSVSVYTTRLRAEATRSGRPTRPTGLKSPAPSSCVELEREHVLVLVALDSNVVDLVELACRSPAHIDAMEAMEPPPRFDDLSTQPEVEVFACYWLLAMAPAWRSTLYTFSDFLYDEVAPAPHAGLLIRVAVDVLVRDWQEPEFRVPDPARRPKSAELVSLGIEPADAIHVADAIGLGCEWFLTNDRRLRKKSEQVQGRWQLALRRPSEFLVEAVQAGAPWTTRAPWPWESIDRIRDGCAIVRNTEER